MDEPTEKHGNGEDIEFSPKNASFKDIIMMHISRITKLSSCELRGGYYSTIPTKEGNEKDIYVEDTREALELSLIHI